MADPHRRQKFFARCTATGCTFETTKSELFYNHLRHECAFLNHGPIIISPVFSRSNHQSKADFFSSGVNSSVINNPTYTAAELRRSKIRQLFDAAEEIDTVLDSDFLSAAALSATDSNVAFSVLSDCSVSTYSPLVNASVVPSFASAPPSDPTLKNKPTIKVSVRPSIQPSSTESVAFVTQSVRDIKIGAPVTPSALSPPHPILACIGPPYYCRACNVYKSTDKTWSDHIATAVHIERQRICISFFDQGLDVGYVLSCLDTGSHPSELRDHLAGSNSFRGVQASTVLNQPDIMSYANQHFRSGVVSALSDAIDESLASHASRAAKRACTAMPVIDEADEPDFYANNFADYESESGDADDQDY